MKIKYIYSFLFVYLYNMQILLCQNYNLFFKKNKETKSFYFLFKNDSFIVNNKTYYHCTIKNKVLKNDIIDGYWNYNSNRIEIISNKSDSPILFSDFSKFNYYLNRIKMKSLYRELSLEVKMSMVSIKHDEIIFNLRHTGINPDFHINMSRKKPTLNGVYTIREFLLSTKYGLIDYSLISRNSLNILPY